METTVLLAGSVAYSMTGRSAKPVAFDGVEEKNLYTFHKMAFFEGKRVARVFSGPAAVHFAAVTQEGELYVWGRNERSQLGLGHLNNVYRPVKVALPGPVASVAIGARHTLVVLKNGDVFSAGDNKLGQCGIGKTSDMVSKFTKVSLPDGGAAQAVAAGGEFSMALASDGSRVFACGCPQYGQLGNGTTGEYIVSAGRSGFKERSSFEAVAEVTKAAAGTKVTSVVCGTNHTTALLEDGRVLTWGHGGYGRLGLGDSKDTLLPAFIKLFDHERNRVRYIATGAAATFFVTRTEMLYMCGITKKSGEANMYPKPITDLAGFKVRAVGSGSTSTVVAADTSLVGWGPSPNCGEMGFGEAQKSSTKCKLVDDAEGCTILDVSAGMNQSLLVLDVTPGTPAGEAAAKAVASGFFPAYEAIDPPSAGGAGAGAAASATGKRKADAAPAGGASAAKKAKK